MLNNIKFACLWEIHEDKKNLLLWEDFLLINGRENRIWTCNLMVPNHAHYQVVLFPDMARPIGVEPITFWSVVKRSIQLSYGRTFLIQLHGRKFSNGGSDWNRTNDTRIFSPLLYRLSYRAINGGSNETRTRDLLRDRQAC